MLTLRDTTKACWRCGSLTTRPLHVRFRGELQAVTDTCQACFDRIHAEMMSRRAVFEKLLDRGLDLTLANNVMIDAYKGSQEHVASRKCGACQAETAYLVDEEPPTSCCNCQAVL